MGTGFVYLASYLTSFLLFFCTASALQGLLSPPEYCPPWARLLVHWGIFFLQGLLVVTVFVTHPNSLLHSEAMLYFVTWLMGGIIGVAWPWAAIQHLRAPVYVMAFLATLAGSPVLVASLNKSPQCFMGSHVVFAGLASALLLLAGWQALFLAAQHLLLRRSKPLLGLPPILTLEQVLYGFLWATQLCLTIAMALGLSLLTYDLPHIPTKTIVTAIAWMIVMILLAGHIYKGWRGKTALQATGIALILLMIAYFFSIGI